MKKHYAWVICVACMLLFMCVCGMVTSTFARYLPYIRDDVGLTNTQTEMIVLMRSVVSMISMLFVGRFYAKIKLRTGVALATILLAVSCVFFANAKSVVFCLIAAVLMGVSYSFGSMYPISRILANWFSFGRSTAISVVTCGSGITSVVMPHIISTSEARWGLKGAFYIEAVIVLAIAVVIYVLIRDDPAELAMTSYSMNLGKKVQPVRPKKEVHLSRRGMILLLAAAALVGAGGLTGVNNLSLLYSSTGFGASAVSLAMSVFGFSMIVGKLSYGLITDIYGAIRSNFLFFAFWISGAALNGFIRPEMEAMPVITSALTGLGAAIGTIGIVSWSSDLSEKQSYAECVRKSQLFFNIGNMLFSLVPGILADRYGGYNISYIIFAFLMLLSVFVIQYLYSSNNR